MFGPHPLTTIRPNAFPQQPQVGGQRDEAGKLAAQRAFFAALGQAPAPAAAAAPAAPPAAPQAAAQVNRIAEAAPTAAPQRIARPGSILDIRV